MARPTRSPPRQQQSLGSNFLSDLPRSPRYHWEETVGSRPSWGKGSVASRPKCVLCEPGQWTSQAGHQSLPWLGPGGFQPWAQDTADRPAHLIPASQSLTFAFRLIRADSPVIAVLTQSLISLSSCLICVLTRRRQEAGHGASLRTHPPPALFPQRSQDLCKGL